MVSPKHQLTICPECEQSDQVKTTKAAYSSGVALAAPPNLPIKKVSMSPAIGPSIVLIGLFAFLLIVAFGGSGNNLPVPFMWLIVVLALLCIISVLVVSYMAFQRVVHGDNEAALLYPAYDQAMDTWSHLYYCARDKIIFDPEAGKVPSNTELQTNVEFSDKLAP